MTLRPHIAIALSSSLGLACTAADQDPSDPIQTIAEQVADRLDSISTGTVSASGIEYKIYDLDDIQLTGEVTATSCDSVDQQLATMCDELFAAGETSYCNYYTTFYYAHDVPRCAVRFEVTPPSTGASQLPSIYALDFTGTPLDGPAPLCGNGTIDDGEQCDDGNHELWDGCDSSCMIEEFQGCEAVIENEFRNAGLAMVDADTWSGPRSQIMVNQAVALTNMTAETCDSAITTAQNVCTELQTQMPFVSWCSPSGEWHQGDGKAQCSIRFQVGFYQVSPDDGVFTTALPGVLAFTID